MILCQILQILSLLLSCRVTFVRLRELSPPTFNVATNRKVTVNATCGESVSEPEVYCKLVGFDSYDEGLSDRFNILNGQVCDYCYPSGNESSDKSHPAKNVVDGDSSTWWQSPTISRGRKYNRITLSIDMQQLFQVAYVYITMANSPRPGVWALERSVDNGETWDPWQYFAGNDAECQKYFGMHADLKISHDEDVICSTEFSRILPIEGGEIFVSLTSGRPSAKNLYSNNILQHWIQATNIRLRLIQTKTMLGHLMSVAIGDKTVTRRYYYSIKEISVGGRCVCNGHAYVCPPSSDDLLLCQCQHNTAGINCDQCAEGFTQKKWRQYTASDLFHCEPCNCHGHSHKCHYDETIDASQLSLDIHGNYEGGGVCEDCQRFTDGINCQTCISGYFRPIDVLPNATEPCIPCQCDHDERLTGNCAPDSGKCECKLAFRGAEDCTACSEGFYDYPNCKPCDCFPNGTLLMENGSPFCIAEGVLQCPCLSNFGGMFCDKCSDQFYNFPKCDPCDCNRIGSVNDICSSTNGQCSCASNYGSRKCDKCQDGYYNFPDCRSCNCDSRGTEKNICDKIYGYCECKEGFSGERCEQCSPGWFNFPNCQKCECSSIGSNSENCEFVRGQCPCYNNYGGRKCDQCSPGYHSFPECTACLCDSLGSKGVSCDSNGLCSCLPNFIGLKCDKCGPERYNYPLCEECNCNPDGVSEDFFARGGCASVPLGSLCSCKEKVSGRICDTCKPLYWNLQNYNPQGCEDCSCFTDGTIGSLALCDSLDGQCACKPNVKFNRQCSECTIGFYGLTRTNVFGCRHCECDVGGTAFQRNERSHNCDRLTGQCPCKSGMMGRRCDEVQDGFYIPTLHQFQYEIEDGYRPDQSSVRIGYDEYYFPNYSWRGYGLFSPLQKTVLQDVPINSQSVYRIVLRYINTNTMSVLGKVSVTSIDDGQEGSTVNSQTHKINLPPTGGHSQFVTVSGDKGIYASLFDMEPGTWTVAIHIDNDSNNKEILVDYFVLLPNQFYESRLLKEDVYVPCKAGERSSYCRDYSYPNLYNFNPRYATNFQRPDGSYDVYSWGDQPHILQELGSEKMALLAKWQPLVQVVVPVEPSQQNVLLFSYFTPSENEAAGRLEVRAKGKNVLDNAQSGQAVISNCQHSFLCRQVVMDSQNRIGIFEFNDNEAIIELELFDPEQELAIDSVVAIPLSEWSLDFITPSAKCIKKDGNCLPFEFKDNPEGSVLVNFEPSDSAARYLQGIYDPNKPMAFVNGNKPSRININGKVSQAGMYIFVVQYHQPGHSTYDVKVNLTSAGNNEELNVEEMLRKGQYQEAVLSLPNCQQNTGCRTTLTSPDGHSSFYIPESFHLRFKNLEGKQVWFEHVLAIPESNFNEGYLKPEKVDKRALFAKECGQQHFYIDQDVKGFCKEALVSISSNFNSGAQNCDCSSEGSQTSNCNSIGGQCDCKPHVIGRQCTRCKPGYFGFPNCKMCSCPPTAQCNENNGECICAPHVTGTLEKPCSRCEEETFGYDPITGCQECLCEPFGTIQRNTSCSLETGNCFCNNNVEGRTCHHCSPGYFDFPNCNLCPCDLKGTTEDICSQTTSECLCKSNVEGHGCDRCKVGSFNLKETNPDGCTDCFCFGKTTYCKSQDNLIRRQLYSMDNWEMTGLHFKGKTVMEQSLLIPESLPNYSGELAVGLDQYQFDRATNYFKAPSLYTGSQIASYGAKLKYTLMYSGYESIKDSSPDVAILSKDETLYYYYGGKVLSPNVRTNFTLILEPHYWTKINGKPAERSDLMIALHHINGIYIKANYGNEQETGGQVRLSDVILETASHQDEIVISESERVHSVEHCECPPGYYGSSCENCDEGYYRISESKMGPVCVPCKCNNHANVCHPWTGECVVLEPITASALTKNSNYCHLDPEKCVVSTAACQHNTTGSYCEKCNVGYFGDASLGRLNDCQPCPCPLTNNNFALSCDALLDPYNQVKDYCVCQQNYVGEACQFCAPGYYGEPDVVGGYCRPCECNKNIDITDLDACDRFSGICQKCLYHTTGDDCAICEPWYFGDAIDLKNCKSCDCNRKGTDYCDHISGRCVCLPGVEGERCDRCIRNHWGFESSSTNGCYACNCTEASVDSQCDQNTGQCTCLPGVSGQKCDQCQTGFWNVGPNGCESCGCKTEFAVGGTCDQKTGQCQCLEGVIGQNCDHCPSRWVFLVNETRIEIPEWKRPFRYREGCFPCSSCVSDLMDITDKLNSHLSPIMKEFLVVESSYFAYRKLNYIQNDLKILEPEIQLLNPQESSRRLQPLEQQVYEQQTSLKSLNLDYKLNVMTDLKKDTEDLEKLAHMSRNKINQTKQDIYSVIIDMQKISDGLGTGVTPEQLETSVKHGNEILNEMKRIDLLDDRKEADEEQKLARDLAERVKEFSSPVQELKNNVTTIKERVEQFKFQLDDLNNNSVNAMTHLGKAKKLNFRNSNPAASNKQSRIVQLLQDTKDKNKMTSKLIEDSNTFLRQAGESYEDLQKHQLAMESQEEEMKVNLENLLEGIERNRQRILEGQNHGETLRRQAEEMKSIKENALADPNLLKRTLEAVNSYQTIVESVDLASKKASNASKDASEAANMSAGVGNKANQSKDRTNELYEMALEASTAVRNELTPQLESAKNMVADVTTKSKTTKSGLEIMSKGLAKIKQLSDSLQSTTKEATDAETLAHDALASIDSRSDEITQNLGKARKLQDDYAEMKISLDTSFKVLKDIEEKRSKREIPETDVNSRINRLFETEKRLSKLTGNVTDLLITLKSQVKNIREEIVKIGKPGIEFHQNSHLELKNPVNLKSQSLNTEISLFFNVCRRANGDERAFIFYMGNLEETHTKMPRSSTDDFLAVEVVEGGRVKTTVDMGSGISELYSNRSINYGEWHHLIISRLGHKIQMKLMIEESPEDVIVDSFTGDLSPLDEFGRPFGSVFNLHPEYSKIYVGGFPTNARIQTAVRETYMEGQIEGLKIGNSEYGLWNFVSSHNIKGSPSKNKFRSIPETGFKLTGDGYVLIDKSNYISMENEFDIRLSFKADRSNGILLLMGNPEDGDFAVLELVEKFVVYKYNLGSGLTELSTSTSLTLGEWYNVDINRQGRTGKMYINGEYIGSTESPGSMDQLSVADIHFGGYPGTLPYSNIRTGNFSGCLKNIYIGPDQAELGNSLESLNVKDGCLSHTKHIVSFLASNPGYMHLNDLNLDGNLRISFMFRTNQPRGLLMYMQDMELFYYISLSFFDGFLNLKVFPRYEIASAEKGLNKPLRYDDDEYHTVSIILTQYAIILHIDDYESFKIPIENKNEMPLLTKRYNTYFGGLPESVTPMAGSTASAAPFIGCLRDLIVGNELYDFNNVAYHTGLNFGECKMEIEEPSEEIFNTSLDTSTEDINRNILTNEDLEEPGEDNEDEKEESEWDMTSNPEGSPPSERWGECKLPIYPASDEDISMDSGMRFGTQKDTYLEFTKQLKIKKKSEFEIDFRSTEPDGIIFYIANERNTDFITLFLKGGRIIYGFNCGSGATYIETENIYNDGEWHRVQFNRQGNRGSLFVDGTLKGEETSFGATKNLDILPEFYLGGLNRNITSLEDVDRNLMKVTTGFVGCLRRFRQQKTQINKWKKNPRNGVIACSEKVEPGHFFSGEGGYIQAFRRYRVGLDFDITMEIKPRNISGILLAIQGRRDYLILQLVNGAIQFTVDNGRKPITSIFKTDSNFQFCDGNWHRVHAVKAKNVVTLSVNNIFAQPGIGVPGVSSTDTNHGLYIGGHPKQDKSGAGRLLGLITKSRYVGCIRNIIIETSKLVITTDMIKGNVSSHVCPTI